MYKCWVLGGDRTHANLKWIAKQAVTACHWKLSCYPAWITCPVRISYVLHKRNNCSLSVATAWNRQDGWAQNVRALWLQVISKSGNNSKIIPEIYQIRSDVKETPGIHSWCKRWFLVTYNYVDCTVKGNITSIHIQNPTQASLKSSLNALYFVNYIPRSLWNVYQQWSLYRDPVGYTATR